MTTNFGEGTAQRTCAAADRTGHAMLHTLYQQSLKHDAEFYIEYFAIDLIMEDGVCRGVVALDLAEGRLHRFRSKSVILATGGYGRAYFRSGQMQPIRRFEQSCDRRAGQVSIENADRLSGVDAGRASQGRCQVALADAALAADHGYDSTHLAHAIRHESMLCRHL